MKNKDTDKFYYKTDLHGVLFEKFGIPVQIIQTIKFKINAMYTNTKIKNITPDILHLLFDIHY